MKKKVLLFLLFATLLLCVVPALNLAFRWDASLHGKIAKESLLARLYRNDLFIGFLQRLLLPLKVSLKSEEVVIGKQGWLFLGDGYCEILRKHRFGTSASNRETLDAIAEAHKSWDAWFRKNGVKSFRVMICPDKSSVYPEYLPAWIARTPKMISPGELLSDRLGQTVVYLKEPLLSAKSLQDHCLYYLEDSHWNVMGAWIAYEQFFRDHFSEGWGKFKILGHDDVSFRNGDMRFGDLSRLLKLPERPDERDVIPVINTPSSVVSERINWKTSNVPINLSENPILVRSKGALNNSRVLWIRDSYGEALSSFMAATFSDILQAHYLFTSQEKLAEMVQEFRPDYVFFTVVERQMLADCFTKKPPLTKEVK